MMVGNIKIVPKQGGICHKVIYDGKELDGVRSLTMSIEPDALPKVDVDLISRSIDFDNMADVNFYLHPMSVAECIKGLRFALATDDVLRDGFVASIKSALDDANNYTPNDKLAEEILDRIIDNGADNL